MTAASTGDFVAPAEVNRGEVEGVGGEGDDRGVGDVTFEKLRRLRNAT